MTADKVYMSGYHNYLSVSVFHLLQVSDVNHLIFNNEYIICISNEDSKQLIL